MTFEILIVLLILAAEAARCPESTESYLKISGSHDF
jgi:hypothetical protein